MGYVYIIPRRVVRCTCLLCLEALLVVLRICPGQAAHHRPSLSPEDGTPHAPDILRPEHRPVVAAVAVELLDRVLRLHGVPLVDDIYTIPQLVRSCTKLQY